MSTRRTSLFKIVLFLLASTIIILALLETLSAVALFHIFHLSGKPSNIEYRLGRLASVNLFNKALVGVTGNEPLLRLFLQETGEVERSSEPSPFFIADEYVGYRPRPGHFRLQYYIPRLEASGSPRARFVHTARILEDGSRATSAHPVNATRQLLVFGESYVWGDSLNDEHTFSWLLQGGFPDLRVRNFAVSGHGNLNNLLSLRQLADELKQGDLVLFWYSFYMPKRSIGNSAFLSKFLKHTRESREERIMEQKIRFPYGRMEDETLRVKWYDLSCASTPQDCWPDAPSGEEERVSVAIFREVLSIVRARGASLLVAGFFFDGEPVIRMLQQEKVPLVNLTSRKEYLEEDSMAPFDGHPGPLSHLSWFRRLEPVIARMIGEEKNLP